MIKSIAITNHVNESYKITLTRPDLSGFLISRIDGLGPPKAEIGMIDLATNDGGRYNSAKVTPRNITMDIIFHDNEAGLSIEELRQKSYKYFPIKKQIKFMIETDERVCETYGYVESNEPVIFGGRAGTSISIICPDPFFYSSGESGTTVSIFYAIEPNFEFEFSNESLSSDLIEFGLITQESEQTIVYEGDVEVGILITIHALGPVENISIVNTQTYESMHIDTVRLQELTGDGMGNGDTIMISTVLGRKYATLLRSGVYYNIINCIDRDVDWFQLSKGDNIFAYMAEEGYSNLEFSIQHQTLYEGV